jgi:hypothetical protein
MAEKVRKDFSDLRFRSGWNDVLYFEIVSYLSRSL